MAAKCGAKAHSTGQPCLQPVQKKGRRCRFHGGKSTGARTAAGKAITAKNARKAGIYDDQLNPEELRWARGIRAEPSKDLEHEIMVAKLQIRRSLAAWETWSTANPEGDLPVVETKTSTTAGEPHHAEIHRRRPDLWTIIDRALGRVGRLTEQQARVVEFREALEKMAALEERLPDNP